MNLVDYSDSDSEVEVPTVIQAPPSAPNTTTAGGPSKRSFQKLASSGKILVSLPSAAATDDIQAEQPPTKRARADKGGSRFSNFSSFLPPPTKTGKPGTIAKAGTSKPAPRPGVLLKTSADAAFSRDGGDDGIGNGSGSGLSLPAPKAPHIPDGQKSAEDVKLVGKPLMFRPLSVAKKPVKKKFNPSPASATIGSTPPAISVAESMQSTSPKPTNPAKPAKPAKPTKVSLFSLEEDDKPATSEAAASTGIYEPLFAAAPTEDVGADDVTGPYDASLAAPAYNSSSQSESLSTIADDLNLTSAQRRELFGRGGRGGRGGAAIVDTHASKVINFNMDREYAHNEALRAAGETVQHNPVRAIQPGKHSLKQLVDAVQNNQDALEENFAKNRATQREASGRYGWR